jgi:hypothetical protein
MIFHWDEKSFNSKEIWYLHIPILNTWEPHSLEWHVVSTNNIGQMGDSFSLAFGMSWCYGCLDYLSKPELIFI